MKHLTKIITLCIGLFFTFAMNGQNEDIRFYVLNEQNKPIEGVYLSVINKNFWYSDSIGAVNLKTNNFTPGDSLQLQHVSYKTKTIDLYSLFATLPQEPFIRMESDIKALEEVTVTPLNLSKLVKEAVSLIPILYETPFVPSIAVHADIDIFDVNDSTSMIYFKGALQIVQTNPKKLPLVYKIVETENITEKSLEQLYPIRISRFAEMIPLTEQGVIEKNQNYNFDKYEYVNYRGNEAIQVHFSRKKGNFTQIGYMIICKESKAIVFLQFSTQPMKNVMKSTTKGGVRNTDLDSHKVEINYALNANNKYEFESGMYHVQYTNRWKNTTKSVVLNSSLKRIPTFDVQPGTEISIEKLFIQ